MYAETDLLLALVKQDDWLGERACQLFAEHREDLWTSALTLVELMLVAYREERDVQSVVAAANALLEVRGDAATVLAAATYVAEEDLTPFDALHLVRSGTDPIVSSDGAYDDHTERIPLEPDD